MKDPESPKQSYKKKTRTGGIGFPDFGLEQKTTVIQSVQYWHKNRHMDPRTGEPRNKPMGLWSIQFSSVSLSCVTLCDPMNYSTPVFPVHHQLSELTQTHVHQVGDAIQPFHPLSFLSLPPSIFPSIRVFPRSQFFTSFDTILEFQLQHQSFQ